MSSQPSNRVAGAGPPAARAARAEPTRTSRKRAHDALAASQSNQQTEAELFGTTEGTTMEDDTQDDDATSPEATTADGSADESTDAETRTQTRSMGTRQGAWVPTASRQAVHTGHTVGREGERNRNAHRSDSDSDREPDSARSRSSSRSDASGDSDGTGTDSDHKSTAATHPKRRRDRVRSVSEHSRSRSHSGSRSRSRSSSRTPSRSRSPSGSPSRSRSPSPASSGSRSPSPKSGRMPMVRARVPTSTDSSRMFLSQPTPPSAAERAAVSTPTPVTSTMPAAAGVSVSSAAAAAGGWNRTRSAPTSAAVEARPPEPTTASAGARTAASAVAAPSKRAPSKAGSTKPTPSDSKAPQEKKKASRSGSGLSKNPMKLPYINKRPNDYNLLKRDHRARILYNVWKMLVHQHHHVVDWPEAKVARLEADARLDLTDYTSDDKELFVPFPYTVDREPALSRIEFRRQVNWSVTAADNSFVVRVFLLSTLGLPTLKNIRQRLPANERALVIVDHIIYPSCLKLHMPNVIIFSTSMFMFDFAQHRYNRMFEQSPVSAAGMQQLMDKYDPNLAHFPCIIPTSPNLLYFYGFCAPPMVRYVRASVTAGRYEYWRHVRK